MSGVVLSTPEAIFNAALVRAGSKARIGSMLEGSDLSRIGLVIYGQTRDALLQSGNWDFALRTATLTLLKSAPASWLGVPWSNAYPPRGWAYEYLYPADALTVLNLTDQSQAQAGPAYAPRARSWRIYNDAGYTPAKKAILSNIANADVNYRAQVTDPAAWEAGFIDALITEIVKVITPVIANPQLLQAAIGEAAQAKALAEVERG